MVLKILASPKAIYLFIIFSLETQCNYTRVHVLLRHLYIYVDTWAPHAVSLTLGMSHNERNVRGYAQRRQSKRG